MIELEKSARSGDLDALICAIDLAMSSGCQRYYNERSKLSKLSKRPATCWEFDEGRRRPCAICVLVKSLGR